MVVSQKWQTSGMQKYLRKKKIFSNGHVPNLYLTGSVYLFGFLFLHQAVETSQPCKTVQFSSSQLAKDLYKYICIYDQYAWCIEVLIFDIKEENVTCFIKQQLAPIIIFCSFMSDHIGILTAKSVQHTWIILWQLD